MFQPPDRQCSHFGPLVLFCKAHTLLIACCQNFWFAGWLLAYFLPLSSPNVSFASMHIPSCILLQCEVRSPCAKERLVDAYLFSLTLIQVFLNLFSSVYVPCHRAVTTLGSKLTSNRRPCLLIYYQASVTRSQCLRTLFSTDTRLINFHTPLLYVDFRSVLFFRRGSCDVTTARFFLLCYGEHLCFKIRKLHVLIYVV